MALNLGTLLVQLRADSSGMNIGLSQAQRSLTSFAASVGRTAAVIGTLAGAAGLGGVAASAVMAAARFEQATAAFTTMLGSGEKAAVFLAELREFAKKTPFEFQGLQENARLLMAFGFQAEDILRVMTAMGEAVSAFGGGNFEIERIARALGQMRGSAHVMTQDINQLIQVGIPAWKLLGQFMGKSEADVRALVEAGKIPGLVGVEAMVVGMTKRFKGSMAGQMQTLLGQWSNAKDAMSEILLTLGQEIIAAFDLKGKLAGTVAFLTDFQERLGEKGILGALREVAGIQITKLAEKLGLSQADLESLESAMENVRRAVKRLVVWINTETQGMQRENAGLWSAIADFAATAWALMESDARIIWGSLVGFWKQYHVEIERVTKPAWANIKTTIETALGLTADTVRVLTAAIQGDWEGTWSALSQMGDRMLTALRTLTDNTLKAIAGLFGAELSWATIGTAFTDLGDRIAAWFTELISKAKEWGRQFWPGFLYGLSGGAIIDAIKGWFGGTPGTLPPPVQGPPPPVYGPPPLQDLPPPSAPTSAPGSAAATVSALQEQLDYARALRDAISYDASIPQKVRDIQLATYDRQIEAMRQQLQTEQPTATPFAQGGIVTRPTLAMIGEAGPEAVVPLSRGGLGGITINVNGADDPDRVAQMIVRRLKTLLPSLV